MKVNPEISKTLTEISKESVKLANNPTAHYNYIRRLLKVFSNDLKEEDRIFITNMFLEMVHYRSALLDPELILTAANIKMKTILFTSVMVALLIILTAMVFKTNDSLNGVIDYFSTIMKALSLGKGN